MPESMKQSLPRKKPKRKRGRKPVVVMFDKKVSTCHVCLPILVTADTAVVVIASAQIWYFRVVIELIRFSVTVAGTGRVSHWLPKA